MLGLDISYMYSKFDNSIFSRFRDLVSTNQNLNGSRNLPRLFQGWFVILG